MIVLPGPPARRFLALLRHCQSRGGLRRDPFVILRCGRKGLSFEAALGEVALRLEHPGRYPEGVLTLTASSLGIICAGEEVKVERTSPNTARAHWQQDGSSRTHDLDPVEPSPHLCFPESRSRLRKTGPGFLAALRHASETAPSLGGGSLHRVLLRGRTGQVAATDGRQLLVQGGFSFPWDNDALVPALKCWNSRELPGEEEVFLARGEKHVLMRVGPWSFALAVEEGGRFPDFEAVIPDPKKVFTRLRLGPDAIALLRKELPKLAGMGRQASAVVLTLGREVVVEARDEVGRPKGSLKVPGAEVIGKPCRVLTSHYPLLRALKLGFQEVELVHPEQPLCCRDERRTYVWMPLAKSDAPTVTPPRQSSENTKPEQKEETVMPDPMANGRNAPGGEPAPIDPLAEAEAIRGLLGEAQARLGRLLSALKQHRRQARAVRQAVASLRDLPPLVP